MTYFKLLQGDLLLQEPPYHADHSVELCSCVLAIRDHFDEGQRGQLILCDDWLVLGGQNEGRNYKSYCVILMCFKTKHLNPNLSYHLEICSCFQ